MSIEKLIEANTAALVALTAALGVTAEKPVAAPAAAKPAPAATSALDYEKDVKPLALRVAKDKGRDALIAILGEFKVAQANLLTPEQYSPFITACNKVLATKK